MRSTEGYLLIHLYTAHMSSTSLRLYVFKECGDCLLECGACLLECGACLLDHQDSLYSILVALTASLNLFTNQT